MKIILAVTNIFVEILPLKLVNTCGMIRTFGSDVEHRRNKTLGGPCTRNSEGPPNQWLFLVLILVGGSLDIVHPVHPFAMPLVWSSWMLGEFTSISDWCESSAFLYRIFT